MCNGIIHWVTSLNVGVYSKAQCQQGFVHFISASPLAQVYGIAETVQMQFTYTWNEFYII